VVLKVLTSYIPRRGTDAKIRHRPEDTVVQRGKYFPIAIPKLTGWGFSIWKKEQRSASTIEALRSIRHVAVFNAGSYDVLGIESGRLVDVLAHLESLETVTRLNNPYDFCDHAKLVRCKDALCMTSWDELDAVERFWMDTDRDKSNESPEELVECWYSAFEPAGQKMPTIRDMKLCIKT
jgi:hypothetical protein